MAIKRITISVPLALAERIEDAADEESVSGWVTELIKAHFEESDLEAAFLAYCAAIKPTAQDEKRSRSLHARLTRGIKERGPS